MASSSRGALAQASHCCHAGSQTEPALLEPLPQWSSGPPQHEPAGEGEGMQAAGQEAAEGTASWPPSERQDSGAPATQEEAGDAVEAGAVMGGAEGADLQATAEEEPALPLPSEPPAAEELAAAAAPEPASGDASYLAVAEGSCAGAAEEPAAAGAAVMTEGLAAAAAPEEPAVPAGAVETAAAAAVAEGEPAAAQGSGASGADVDACMRQEPEQGEGQELEVN